jgi:DNA repair exonuclease SbcCD ATPase subunit
MADRNAIELNIGLRADDSQLAGDIARIKAKVDNTSMPVGEVSNTATAQVDATTKSVEKLGDETKKTGSKAKEAMGEGGLGSVLRDTKKKFGEQIEVVQGLIGKLTAVGMVAATFYKIGEAISTAVIENLKTATDSAREFVETLETNKPVENAQKLQPELEKINQQLQYQYDIINEVNAEMAGGKSAMYLLERRAKAEANITDLKQAQAEVEKKLINELAQKNAQEASKKRDQDKKDAEAKEKAMRELADKQHDESVAGMEREAERYKAQQDSSQKILDDLERIRMEQRSAQEEQAKAMKLAAEGARDAWMRSLRDIRNEMNNTFGNDQANSLSQLSAQFQVGGIVAQAAMNRIYTEGVG